MALPRASQKNPTVRAEVRTARSGSTAGRPASVWNKKADPRLAAPAARSSHNHERRRSREATKNATPSTRGISAHSFIGTNAVPTAAAPRPKMATASRTPVPGLTAARARVHSPTTKSTYRILGKIGLFSSVMIALQRGADRLPRPAGHLRTAQHGPLGGLHGRRTGSSHAGNGIHHDHDTRC